MNKKTHTINVGKSFPDYVTFKRVFDKHCRSEGVVYRKDGKTVEWAKKKIKSARLHFKKDFEHLTIRFERKHYGTYESKNQGKRKQ